MVADFTLGERVRFEILVDNTPRWSWDTDRYLISGIAAYAPPQYQEGIVIRVNNNDRSFDVESSYQGELFEWNWYQPSNNINLYNWDGYLTRCEAVKGISSLVPEIKNNDGRSECFACGGATRKCGGLRYDVDYRVCCRCGK